MEKNYNNKYCIVRTEKAGVFAGNCTQRNGNELTIKNARRLWYWNGAATISQLSVDGTASPSTCKFTVPVDELEVFGVIEIIPCTKKAEESIKGVREWKI